MSKDLGRLHEVANLNLFLFYICWNYATKWACDVNRIHGQQPLFGKLWSGSGSFQNQGAAFGVRFTT
jgi:hypothetical protein